MSTTLDLKPEFHDPVILYKPLADYVARLRDAIATNDQALLNYLLVNFRVDDYSAFRIGLSRQHGNEHITGKETL